MAAFATSFVPPPWSAISKTVLGAVTCTGPVALSVGLNELDGGPEH
jgi:hypothetical protein